ncbi:ATP-binding protein [Vulcaniibacterium tengchongense]|uniref:histidine kinase n=1 Tax=Vulcaniibacterium tengchongense TaxID=1273429 RepID=A0A3N4W497_9GAMM|nr:ATP-binding protein [Vulcaniibacterium tengchongense]RPE80890.1 histidine kinase [Vulcaniibacterium tengchongense]
MNETGQPSAPWSDDMLWAVSMDDTATLLLDGSGALVHGNDAARVLALRLRPDAAEPDLAALLACVPEQGWRIACRDGRWIGEIAVPERGLVLEIKAFAGRAGGRERRLVTVSDVSARSAREGELQRRHDELLSTYDRLASAQEQLLQSEKMASIGQLAAGVAHEINNPIGYVHSNIGTLQEYVGALLTLIEHYANALQSDDPAAARPALRQLRERLDVDFIVGDVPKLLEESREGIERVTKIVQDLKEFSHVERDEPMRPSDLRRGLESTLNIVWNDLKYKARVEKHYQDAPPVECHLSEINQVFMNLLINAGQAIAERGIITLAMGCEGDEVWVSIADTGCGIPEESLQRIFDPFYTTKPIGRGTGLGLAIAYRIVAKHHGRIEVSSKVGQGSTFRVVLPVAQPKLSRPRAG